MLEAVEVLPGARRALRRAVSLECRVTSDLWDEPVPHEVADLSPYGMWVQTPFPLEPGSEVLLSFTPPRWRSDRELCVLGRVCRAALGRRRTDSDRHGMGIVFEHGDPAVVQELRATLRGLPPPLPRATERPERELVWVDMLLTCEEADGDVVEVSERVGSVPEEELAVQPVGELLTGGVPAPWTPRFLC